MKFFLVVALVALLAEALPAGIDDPVKQISGGVNCADGLRIHADFFYHPGTTRAPAVVVVHGFSRRKEHMRGWGQALAELGYVSAVINLPFLTNIDKNTASVVDFVEKGRRNLWPVPVQNNGSVSLLGFSMGGAVTLLAASKIVPPITAWAGLDPVDFNDRGAIAAQRVCAPGLALLAEPGIWNRHGNARRMLSNYGGTLEIILIPKATHADPEWPGDWLVRAACGGIDPARQKIFREKILEFFALHRASK